MRAARFLPLLLLSVLSFFVGCEATPAQRLYLARQSYIGTEEAVTKLIRAGVIKPGPALDATVEVRNEARDGLAAADASIGTFNFEFVMGRLQSALGRLAQFYLDHRTETEAAKQPGAMLWNPSRLQPLLPESRPFRGSSLALRKPSASCKVAKTSPMRNRTHFV